MSSTGEVGCMGDTYEEALLNSMIATGYKIPSKDKAIMISSVIMILSGIFGLIGGTAPTIVALMCLAAFMGAASNFTVSGAVQYWRREDFPSVFARVNPVASLLGSLGPMFVATLLYRSGAPELKGPFTFVLICGIVATVLIVMFKPSKVKALDDKYREAAGKPLDDALAGRK